MMYDEQRICVYVQKKQVMAVRQRAECFYHPESFRNFESLAWPQGLGTFISWLPQARVSP